MTKVSNAEEDELSNAFIAESESEQITACRNPRFLIKFRAKYIVI